MVTCSHPCSCAFTLIVPIATDLLRNNKNLVTVGPLTKSACDRAIRVAETSIRPWILTTATRASDSFDRVVMGHVMQNYMGPLLPKNQAVTYFPARWFTTMGEVLAVAEYIQKVRRNNLLQFESIVFVVKAYQKKRLKMLVKLIFRYKHIRIHVDYDTYEAETDQNALSHEQLGMISNRMLFHWRIFRGEITRSLKV